MRAVAKLRQEADTKPANDGLLPLFVCGHLHNGKIVGKKKMRQSEMRILYILDIKDVKT